MNPSLQALALKSTLETLSLTDDMQQVIEQFTLNYMANHPQLTNKAVNMTSFYYVFIRPEDPRSLYQAANDAQSCPGIQLFNHFPTEPQAIDLITTKGRDIVYAEEGNYKQPLVLTVIRMTGWEALYMRATLEGVSDNKYLSFAFTKRGFDMLRREHMVNLQLGDATKKVPWWLTYVDEMGNSTRGWLMQHLNDYHATINYCDDDAGAKQQDVKELESFLNNPDKYIAERRQKKH